METSHERAAASAGWRNFAAYVTWGALAVLALMVVLRGTELEPWRRALGAAAVLTTLTLGITHLCSSATERGLWWRWWSIGVQTLAALGAVYLLDEQVFAVFLIIIVGTASESGDRHASLLWLALANALLLAIFLATAPLLQALISFPLYLGFQLFAFAMNTALTSERRVREQLASVNAELLATRRLLQESARNEERLRISRELHDVAGHRLTALKLNLRAELDRESPLPERLSLAYDLSDELLSDIRAVVHQLRAADEIDVPSALALLRNQHPGVEIHLDVTDRLRIDGIEVAEAIVRTTQEAITNALKHGKARQVWIALDQDEGALRLTVRDDGEGGEPSSWGAGLKGMSERAELLGGALVVDRASGRGWTLRLSLPSEATA